MTVPDKNSPQLARTLTEKLTAHYAIVAEAVPDATKRVTLTLERTIIPTLLVADGDSRVTARLKGIARMTTLPLNAGDRVRSLPTVAGKARRKAACQTCL